MGALMIQAEELFNILGLAMAGLNKSAQIPLTIARLKLSVTSNYDDIFHRYLCCLLIKQAPKPILDSIGAASLRSIRGEEAIESLLSGDNDLRQSIVKAFGTYNRVTKSFGDDYSDTSGGPGT
ncbi:unnamed protein product [Heligmosomoides polygyrus]|uniref:Annexin n=1 Tax=Heligmosomoides polygyrus TaxID=6339 RepID=A0A183FJA9_HELPZ|nr:unnamed protein product [Heligmosomoides polygyrus]